MHDLVITGGNVVDGTGAPARLADVAISDGRVTEVGRVDGPSRRTIDADGLLVTPGFVDIHTHYDGQITWDPLLTPSCWHGVTTVVMGNCGVGFAPAAPDRHDWLIALMEGVEDIPGAALSEGITWNWETFPEFLDHLDTLPLAVDVGTQVPHGAVRAYVMGERGARNEPATPDDIERMAAIVEQGLLAGALGFSTSRTIAHCAIDGEPVPGTFAAEDELFGIGRVLGRLGRGVFELAPAGALGEDLIAPQKEIDWICRLAAEINRPVSFALNQNNNAPHMWRELLDAATRSARDGHTVRPQVHARTVSLLLGLTTFHPFNFTPSWAEIGMLPLAEQVGRMRSDTQFRERILGEMEAVAADGIISGFMNPDRMFQLGDPPDYEPAPSEALAARAAASGRRTWELVYDLLLEQDGRELLNSPILNYADGNLDAAYEMLASPVSAFGLGDGGAHAGQTCDASSTTFLLTHWARDRQGAQLGLEAAVHKMTGATADLYDLRDRGRLAPGMKADVNIIDFERLQLRRPELVHDLPAGGRRLIQRADGYVATINGGEVVMQHGEETGARPGHLVRGPVRRPAS
jgi:N-acyl-D-aspartate/D-glutamate deacylase